MSYPRPQSTIAPANAAHRRLLMPAVRQARHPSVPLKLSPTPHKSPQSRLSRSRASSVIPYPFPSQEALPVPQYDDWIGGGARFEIVQDVIKLSGYQIYAVEKWVVERRPVTVLTVFTGDPRHTITVTTLAPQSSLSPHEAQTEWDKALHHLRRDAARPKETEHGVIMVTSLANFRSDFTIVHIPRGNFLDIREQLYVNINLLRMGCSGRSALTLEEPSDTTKDRFISMYHLSDKVLARSQLVFNPTVIEFIKLIQTSLAICGIFPLSPDERNGLMCDATLEGIQRWVTVIGEPSMEMERTLDPAVVAALFSTILTISNKLQALGHSVPKDPLIDPTSFLRSLQSFQNTLKSTSHTHSFSLSHHSSPTPPSSSTILSTFSSPPLGTAVSTTSGSSTPAANSTSLTFLTHQLISSIQSSYDKLKQSESYKVHRVLINKLDDLATDLRTEGRGWFQGNPVFNNNQPLTDLAAFVQYAVGSGPGSGSWSSRDGPPSLRYLWTGRPEEVRRKRKENEAANDIESADADSRLDKDKERRSVYEKEVRSSDDDGEFGSIGKPWPGRVQRKIEVWAALSRAKKLSADFGAKGRAFLSSEFPARAPLPTTPSTSQLLPSVIISRDPAEDDDPLSSGQVSPIFEAQRPVFGMGAYPSTQRSADYDRRITEFDQRRALTKPQYQSRIISWSDPITARSLLDDETPPHKKVLSSGGDDGAETQNTFTEDDFEGWRPSRRLEPALMKKRRSFDDAEHLRGTRILPMERMHIDVELCGQLLSLRRREEHLANVIECLQVLTNALSATNTSLRNDYTDYQPTLAAVESRTAVLQQIEASRTQAEGVTQETQALAYESAQFMVEDLWHMASQPRQKVLALRDKVFGKSGATASRRQHQYQRRREQSPEGGRRGGLDHMQVMLDGREIWVDGLGRTESEAEEEEQLGLSRATEQDVGQLTEDARASTPESEHPNLRPTWLLRLFNYWGTRWGSLGTQAPKDEGTNTNAEATEGASKEALTIPSPLLDGEIQEIHVVGGDAIGVATTSVGIREEVSVRRAIASRLVDPDSG